jgi:DNA repair exonuclease SbcCD ATPase subunit
VIDEAIQKLALSEKRAEIDRLNRDLGAKRFQEGELRRELDSANTAFQEAQRDGTEAGYDRFWEKLTPGDQFCKIPISLARFQCKLRQQYELEPKPPAGTAIKDTLAAKATAAREKIQSLSRNLYPVSTAAKQLETAVATLTRAIAAAETERDTLVRRRGEVERQNTLAIFHAEQAAALCKAIETLESRQERLGDDIEQSKKRQESMQKRRSRQIAALSDLYESSLKALLGSVINGSCHFTREEIDLRADYHGELTSAAIDTLKTIAFDIAALRSGIEAKSHHPAFLLFDSPREADMHRAPYRKIFHHLKELESLAEEPPFQVIITTTEPPPPAFQSAPELILRLDASTKEGRVYRRDF